MDEIIQTGVPFADITTDELRESARDLGVSVKTLQEIPVSLKADGIRENPPNVRKGFYMPIANLVMRYSTLLRVANGTVEADGIADLIANLQKLRDAAVDENGKPQQSYMRGVNKMVAWLRDPDSTPPWTMFAVGNSKIGKFYAWSTLPGATCPGAGECLTSPKGGFGWCYSLNGWRYPDVFFRQLQNTLLLRIRGRKVIEEGWAKIPQGAIVRLYVDGDMDSEDTIRFWMDLCRRRPDIRAYGYSKSWPQFLAIHRKEGAAWWPSNYMLNLSGGTKFASMLPPAQYGKMVDAMRQLPITRGTFIAVPGVKSKMPKPVKAGADNRDRPGHAEHMAEVIAKARAQGVTGKIWSCPGLCSYCMKNGEHACGSEKMRGVNIIIGVH